MLKTNISKYGSFRPFGWMRSKLTRKELLKNIKETNKIVRIAMMMDLDRFDQMTIRARYQQVLVKSSI